MSPCPSGEGVTFAKTVRDYYLDLSTADILVCVRHAIGIVTWEEIHSATKKR